MGLEKHDDEVMRQRSDKPEANPTGVGHPIDHECTSANTPTIRDSNAARRDAGRRNKITFAEASSPKQRIKRKS